MCAAVTGHMPTRARSTCLTWRNDEFRAVRLHHPRRRVRRLRAREPAGGQWRGHAGPLELERGPASNPLFGAFFEAAEQAGYPRTDDVNGYRQEGFAPFDRNVRRGRRLSASQAYLHPVMDRSNLTV